MAQTIKPCPQPPQPIVGALEPTQGFREWFRTLDLSVRSFFGLTNGVGAPVVGPLVNAANDAAAQAAGVPIQGLYRTGNAVQIRLV